ncbi:MAG: YdcH family protein [Candidatus Tectomicrobia bacterium]|uniref:YdcH family protein n=1 Tax=Tectimicrobiota bacterium TaxID=2528274 RepID=A0A932I2N9_UNCTE|nr:YdcH family protein [Candidatus Tectomicrobia bacterium]
MQASGQCKASSADELSRLKNEHHDLDEKIARLESVRFPTPEEEREIKELKKQKLSLKDRIECLAKT